MESKLSPKEKAKVVLSGKVVFRREEGVRLPGKRRGV